MVETRGDGASDSRLLCSLVLSWYFEVPPQLEWGVAHLRNPLPWPLREEDSGSPQQRVPNRSVTSASLLLAASSVPGTEG